MNKSNEKLKVSFYLKKNNIRKGLCPVMGRITVGKDMVQFSCKLEADPSLWNVRAGRLDGKSHHAREVNGEIDKINVAVNARYMEIVSVRGQTTASEVKNAFQGISSSQETLLKIFREHNVNYEKRIGVNISKGTYCIYNNSFKHLETFINRKYHVGDVSFRQLDYSFIQNYDLYLRIDCRMMPNTMLHKIMCLRKMVRIAIGRGIISHDPFVGYSPERPKACQKFVPMDDLEKMMKATLKSPALNMTRDMFLFSCFTGLAYVDLHNLTNQNIVKTDDGSLWLNINRQKTGAVSKIPLLEIPLQLIEKYRNTDSDERVFPAKSNRMMNIQIKAIAKHCGIDGQLTFHMARHTFATETCLSQGVPIESVSKMMGHNKLSTTQIYAKVTHNKVNEDMNALSEIINGKYILY